jgi:hypothetical protein
VPHLSNKSSLDLFSCLNDLVSNDDLHCRLPLHQGFLMSDGVGQALLPNLYLEVIQAASTVSTYMLE